MELLDDYAQSRACDLINQELAAGLFLGSVTLSLTNKSSWKDTKPMRLLTTEMPDWSQL